jgi:hypothetical protein
MFLRLDAFDVEIPAEIALLVRCVGVEFGVCTYTCFHVSKKERNIFLHAMAYNNRAMGTLFLTLGLVFFFHLPLVF